MFGLKKRATLVYEDGEIEHILGYTLVNRADIISNRAFMDREHELNGMIGLSIRKLSDELDYVTLQYAYKFFIQEGISVERLDKILSTVFDRFIKDGTIIKEERQLHYNRMTSRVHEYLHIQSAAKIGLVFMAYVIKRHDARMGRYIAPVLKTLESNMRKRINAELNAGR